MTTIEIENYLKESLFKQNKSKSMTFVSFNVVDGTKEEIVLTSNNLAIIFKLIPNDIIKFIAYNK